MCTVTATDQSGNTIAGSHAVKVAGEYCDGTDDNGNHIVDELYPELGQPAPGGGVYVCSSVDRESLVVQQTQPS